RITLPGKIMEKRQVTVRVDDRVRLMSAVLSATNYPEKSQERKKYGTHLDARGTRKHEADQLNHPAVSAMQVLLDKHIPLASIFSYALRLTWPGLIAEETPRWVPPKRNEKIKDFYEKTTLAQWWQDEADSWKTPVRHLNEAFAKVDLYGF